MNPILQFLKYVFFAILCKSLSGLLKSATLYGVIAMGWAGLGFENLWWVGFTK